MIRHPKLKGLGFHFLAAAAAMVFLSGFSVRSCLADAPDASEIRSDRLVHRAAGSRSDDPFDGIFFPTIYKSGFDVCTNTDGKPVILLFSSTSCSHCAWVGEIFDAVAMKYMDDGLIEAHHYDKPTGDDLLTEAVETEIPEEFFEIYNRGNPTNRVPFINFSCKYERIGNGYEKDQDADAEGQEMIDVIETLLRVLSEDE